MEDIQGHMFNLLRDIRETQLVQAEEIGKIGASVEALAGPQGRVTKLETSSRNQWWFTSAVAPMLAVAHAVARKLGVAI